FNSQAQDKRRPSDSRIPFEFCYDIGSNKSEILLPNVTLFLDPVALVSDETGPMYCLCIIKSLNINIIGRDSDQASTAINSTPSHTVPPATAIGEATKETENVFHPSVGTSCLNLLRYTVFIMFLLVLAIV
ncbi:hypothetical protein GIB67_037869, partial [Kingdonia uniflora]